MAKQKQKALRVDREFRFLLPPLDSSEYATLEATCLRDGILDPIFTWKGIIVDGHNRYEIAKKHRLLFKTRELDLPDRDAVKRWILEFQLARRSISTFDKIALALRLEESYREKARENQRLSQGRGKKGRVPDTQPFQSVDVLTELGKVAGSSRRSVSMVKYIVENGSTEIREKCSRGSLPISKGYLYSKEIVRGKRKSGTATPTATYENDRGKYENTIICGDVLQTLRKVPDGIVTCCIFSPPYNNGTDYGYGAKQDSLSHPKYVEWLGKVAVQCSRVLRPCGRMIVIIDSVGVRQDDDGYEGKKYTVYPDLIAKVRELDCGLAYKDEIIWDKIRHGGRATAWGSYLSPASPNSRRRHEYVIVWQKGEGPLQNLTGKPSDLTKKEWMQSIYSVWQIPVEGKRHGNHPAPYPEELVRRLIRLYSYPGDLICDPMVGTGTTTAVAASLGRRWLGIDLNPDYCRYALKRTVAAGKK